MTKNILICDANHGGLTLLEEYYKYSDNKLYFYDIYAKLTKKEKDEYHHKYNVTFLNLDEISSDYTVIAPVHMKPVIKGDYTHHEFTSYLIQKHKAHYKWNFKIIEVTGVKGKTTTTSLTSNILYDKNRLVLTSNALTYYSKEDERVLMEGLSITPSSILTALNIAVEEDIIDDLDYLIAEVSLGVTPCADIGILTNILEDYPIADSTSSAHIAKESVFRSSKVICDKKSYDNYYSSHDDAFTVSLTDHHADLYVEDVDYSINNSSFTVVYHDERFKIECFALTDFYINNILFAISVGLQLKVAVKDIQYALRNMKSIPGRTSYRYINDKLVVEEINSGLNATSIMQSIENMKHFEDSFTIILGGDYGITCEEIDEEKVMEYIKTVTDRSIILTGKVGCNIYQKLKQNKYSYYESLDDALDYALTLDDKLIEVIYRSEYSRKMEIKKDLQ